MARFLENVFADKPAAKIKDEVYNYSFTNAGAFTAMLLGGATFLAAFIPLMILVSGVFVIGVIVGGITLACTVPTYLFDVKEGGWGGEW